MGLCVECGEQAKQGQYCGEWCAGIARDRRMNSIRAVALDRGLITGQTLEQCFGRSKPEIEDRNPIVWEALKGWLSGNVYLWGDVGCGKTYLARCLLNRSLEAGQTVCEVKALALFRAWQDWHRPEFREGIANAHVMLLDDLDKVLDWTPSRKEILFELLDSRAGRGLSTILTANTKPDGLKGGMGIDNCINAALDRLNPCKQYAMTGKSMRGRVND